MTNRKKAIPQFGKERSQRIREGVFKHLTLKLAAISGLFVACLYTFGYILAEVVYEDEKKIDNSIFTFFDKISSDRLVEIMKSLTFFGSHIFLLPAYSLLILYFIARKKYRYGLHIAIIALSSTALLFALKNITRRSRPDMPFVKDITNFSFPSGHALSAFIFFSIYIYIVWHGHLPLQLKWIYTAFLCALAAAVGASRIVLRVHYPTDVIAGFCLGIIWVMSSFWIMKKISKNDKEQLKVAEAQETL
ncbi:MAG: phosphatase family protein [Chitinophagaceae bacterium]|nr:phosphatase family protein [Chitinophagaceae bacterium]